MTTVEQEINNLRLEIAMEQLMTRQAMRDGVMFQEIKERKLRVIELIKRLNKLIEANRIVQSN